MHKEVNGRFDEEPAYALACGSWQEVVFVGELPRRPLLGLLGSKTYRKTIIHRTA